MANKRELKAYFKNLLPQIIAIARRHGYALAVHGSMARDLDLIALPWTDKVSDPLEMVKEIVMLGNALKFIDADPRFIECKAVNRRLFHILTEKHDNGKYKDGKTIRKSSGYIELSVTPLSPVSDTATH